MKIVSVMTTTSRGGGEFAAVELLDAMARRGHEAVLITNQPELAAGKRITTVPLEIGPKLSARSWPGIVARWPLLRRRLRAALRGQARFDVLLLHYKKEQLLARGLPAELTPGLAWAEWGPVPGPLTRWPGRWLYVRASEPVRVIIAVSPNTRQSLIDVGVPEAKVVVAPPSLDAGVLAFDGEARARYRSQWGVDDDSFVVGCITRLHRSKRNDVLIDALEFLPPDVSVILAGDGEQEPELRERAARFGDRARFLPTPRGYVQEVLSACDVQVFAPQPLEGAPRSIGFGQLTERPVIASAAVGGIPESIPSGTGTVVSPAHDPRALAETILAYRVDPERRAREGAAGRAHAIVYHDPQRIADIVEQSLLRATGEA